MNVCQEIVGRLLAAERGCVLATLVAVEGSSYRRPGARMLIAGDGARIGSISGGCLEEDLVERSGRVRATGRPEIVVYDTTAENDLIWGVGLGCHGVVRILLEPIAARPDWAVAAAENLGHGRATELAVVWEDAGGALGTGLADRVRPARSPGAPGVFIDSIKPPTALAVFGAG
ncbi:MAG TPA: XdhC family protein, partial [Opitutaceae bacterium]|nr:XdhC family protein [Opitutaceae bacterium]